jgi:hypothetical protein
MPFLATYWSSWEQRVLAAAARQHSRHLSAAAGWVHSSPQWVQDRVTQLMMPGAEPHAVDSLRAALNQPGCRNNWHMAAQEVPGGGGAGLLLTALADCVCCIVEVLVVAFALKHICNSQWLSPASCHYTYCRAARGSHDQMQAHAKCYRQTCSQAAMALTAWTVPHGGGPSSLPHGGGRSANFEGYGHLSCRVCLCCVCCCSSTCWTLQWTGA